MKSISKVIGFGFLSTLVIICIVLSAVHLHEIRNAHYETATVIAIKRENPMIIRFETEDGNLWDEEFDWDTPVDIGDKATLMFKNDDTKTREDDIVLNVFFEEE